jgi:hypothetical protein
MGVEDFSARLQAKQEADADLRCHTEMMMDAERLLADVIQQIRETVQDEDVVKLLRRAIEVIEG